MICRNMTVLVTLYIFGVQDFADVLYGNMYIITGPVELSAGADIVDIAKNCDVDRLSGSLTVERHQLVTSELTQSRCVAVVAVVVSSIFVYINVRDLGL